MRTRKNVLLLPFVLFVMVPALLGLSGCNFFGKKKDEIVQTNPGELASGVSIVGSWTISVAGTASSTANPPIFKPAVAMTQTLTFDPTNTVRWEVRDLFANGSGCTGYGQYRINANDVIVYIQTVSASGCNFPYSFRMASVNITKTALFYTDPDTQGHFAFFASRPQELAPIGVWNFAGAGANASGDGGIDYLLLDAQGYFLVQSTYSGQHYLLEGYYSTAVSGLRLYFFNGDPSHISGDPMSFAQFVTDGHTLELNNLDANGQVVTYTGTKL